MATCLVHMRVKDGQAAAFEAIARSLYEASTGKEPGLRRYEYWRGKTPNSYYCLESFDDHAGFLAHETAPHHEAAADPIMALIEEFELEWVDPVAGAAPLDTTHEQALSPDAGERTRLYADLFPLTLAAWWRALPRGDAPALAPALTEASR
jgi:quinol monooxygenase YgiN